MLNDDTYGQIDTSNPDPTRWADRTIISDEVTLNLKFPDRRGRRRTSDDLATANASDAAVAQDPPAQADPPVQAEPHCANAGADESFLSLGIMAVMFLLLIAVGLLLILIRGVWSFAAAALKRDATVA